MSNNVQRVVIHTPAAGTYEIRVYGVAVAQNAPAAPAGGNPKQDFALVVSNGMGMSLQPVSVAQAIDATGSMDYFGYIEPAKERATQLIDFLRINNKLSIDRVFTAERSTECENRIRVTPDGKFHPGLDGCESGGERTACRWLTPIGQGLRKRGTR